MIRANLFTTGVARGAAGFLLCIVVWELFARSGLFSTALTPPIGLVLSTLWQMIVNGTLFINTGYTLGRVALGMGISFAIALPLGFLMARNQFAERFILPIVSVLMPIPSLAWVPLFTLWFGIGDTATIAVVIYAAFFPLIYNVWAGARGVNPLWVRAASSMGASKGFLFGKVIWPASLPYIITGVRLALGRAWIGVIGGELLASPRFGLGQVLFNAREFLNAGVMLAVLLVIGIIGIIFERLVFQPLENATIRKWGMSSGGRA